MCTGFNPNFQSITARRKCDTFRRRRGFANKPLARAPAPPPCAAAAGRNAQARQPPPRLQGPGIPAYHGQVDSFGYFETRLPNRIVIRRKCSSENVQLAIPKIGTAHARLGSRAAAARQKSTAARLACRNTTSCSASASASASSSSASGSSSGGGRECRQPHHGRLHWRRGLCWSLDRTQISAARLVRACVRPQRR